MKERILEFWNLGIKELKKGLFLQLAIPKFLNP